MAKKQMIPIRAFSVVPGADPALFPAQPIRGPILEVEGVWGDDRLKKLVKERFVNAGHAVRKVFWSEKDGKKDLVVYVTRDGAAHPDADKSAPPVARTPGRRTAVGRRARKMRTR